MRGTRGPAAWARLALLVAVLAAAAVIPGRASSQQPSHCTGLHCTSAGSVLWTHALPGSWIAQSGDSGTVPATDTAYAGVGDDVAAVGSGVAVTAYKAHSGKWLWHVALAGIPAGSAIVSVRAFADVVAVGVEPPAGQGGAARYEVILSSATGRQLRIFPAGAYGGAVEADASRTVIIGDAAVIAYANATGRVLWQRSIGASASAWRVAGGYLYMVDSDDRAGDGSSGGGNSDATGAPALRRISLLTGGEQIVRPSSGAFAGTLGGVLDVGQQGGQPPQVILLFTGPDGVTAYGLNGAQLWPPRRSAVLELADAGQGVVYIGDGPSLIGLNALHGTVVSSVAIAVAAGLYSVSDGVALGLDQDALGEAWGYSLSAKRVVWTSTALPWPHFFVDLSGLGGSTSPATDIALLATCGQLGPAPTAGAAPPCKRPRLAAVLLRSR